MEDGKIKTEEERMQEIEAVEANVKCMKDFTSPEQLYEELIRSIRKYHPSTDISMIKKAYQIASKAHEGQKRKSGEPYIIHPLCVAIILADLELDKETISPIIDILVENISSLSVQKFSSNVSEKLIELVDDYKKEIIFNKLFKEKVLLSLLNNKYGRFVLQKAVKIMQKDKKDEIKNLLLHINLSSQKESNHLKSFLTCF